MSNTKMFFYSIAGLAFGIFLFFKGFVLLKKRQLIENLPTSKIRSLAMGLVEIFGSVVPAEKMILKSPFSSKDCVYYRYTVEELRGSGKNQRWETVKKDEKYVHFYLKDETGMVLVDSNGAKIDIPVDSEFRSNFGVDPPETVKKFLKSQNLRFEGLLLGINKTMKYKEYFVEPKDKLYIIGTAKDNPFMEEAAAKKGVEDVMIGKGLHEKIYYISDKHEKELLKKLRWQSIGGIFGGTLLTIGSLAIMLLNLNLL